MEGLAHLVAESLVRHGFEASFDHRRLQWSKWFRCQDSFDLVLAPCKPGLFALGEELIAPVDLALGERKRMLAQFQISEANDLGMALGRLFLSGRPERERFANGRCFARYVVIEDATQRRAAHAALERWMASSADAATGVPQAVSDDTHVVPDALVREAGRSSAGFVSGPFARAANAATSTFASAAGSAQAADAWKQAESSSKPAQIGPPPPTSRSLSTAGPKPE